MAKSWIQTTIVRLWKLVGATDESSLKWNLNCDLLEGIAASSPVLNSGGRISSSNLPSTLNLTNRAGSPATLPTANAKAAAINPAGTYVAVGSTASPYIHIYPYSPGAAIPVGTKIADPSTLPTGSVTSIVWDPTGTKIAVTMAASPYVRVYNWTGTAFGSAIDPAGANVPLNDSDARCSAWNSTTTYLAFGAHNGGSPTNAFGVLRFTGTALDNLAIRNPASNDFDDGFVDNGDGVVWSKDDAYVIYAYGVTPFVLAFPFANGAFTSTTQITNPVTLPTGRGNGVTISPDGKTVFVAHNTTPFMTAYPWTAGVWGTKIANPDILPPGNGNAVAISGDGTQVVLGCATTPFLVTYPFESNAFGVQGLPPAILPLAAVQAVAITPTAPYGVAAAYLTTSPFFYVYTGRQQNPVPTGFASADVTVTNSATLANATGLVANLGINQTYAFRAAIQYTADTTGGMKLAVMASQTVQSIVYTVMAGAVAITASQQTSSGGAASFSASTSGEAIVEGTITTNATTAGTIQIQFAEGTAVSLTSAVVKAGSTMAVQRVN